MPRNTFLRPTDSARSRRSGYSSWRSGDRGLATSPPHDARPPTSRRMTALLQNELAGSGRGLSAAEAWGRIELEFELARARSIGAALVRVRPERIERLA